MNFYLPIINKNFHEFSNKIQDMEILKDKELIIVEIIESIISSLSILAERTMILEVNVARLENTLVGDTGEERFQYFIDTIIGKKKYQYSLYNEYFELTKLMYKVTENKFNYLIEVINNLSNNMGVIREKFNNNAIVGKVISINTGKGDDHNKGRSVALVTFESGLKIIYKPKSLEIEYKFQEILSWLNSQMSNVLDLYITNIYYEDTFGFMEYISYKECKNKKEVENYYTRIGQLLSVLYILNANDFHHENIIASGENPVLIDLESLLHSSMEIENDLFTRSGKLAEKILAESVYSVGLLPQRITNRVNGEDISIEISGLGFEEDQVAPFKNYGVKHPNSDEICLEEVFGMLTTQLNNPKIEGKIEKSDFYIDKIKLGFISIYRWIENNKSLVEEKIRQTFTGTESRYILRPTYLYSQLLRTSFHPDFLRKEVDRQVILNRIGINADSVLEKFVKSEYEDLLMGDIPYFKCRVNTGEIVDSRGKIISGCFKVSPLEESIRKVNALDEDELKRQLYFIDVSFLAKESDAKKDETGFMFNKINFDNKVEKDEWINLACKIGDYILSKGIEGEKEGVTWISTVLAGVDENIWGLSPVGNDLYMGNCGIALFLAYLGKITGNDKYIDGANKAIVDVIYEIENLKKDYPYLIGAYNGLGGYIYCLFNIGRLLNRKDYEDIAFEQIKAISKIIEKDKVFDVIGGAAGSLGVILDIYQKIDDEYLKDGLIKIANIHFKHLNNSAVKMEDGRIAWDSDVTPKATGYSHGNSGIIANLIRLYAITKNEEILSLIDGAPGILLSRAMLKKYGYMDNELDNEINIAIETMKEKGFGNNPSLCHGDLGNLEILEYVSELTGYKDLKKEINNSFQVLYKDVLSERWNKGTFRGTESLGMMIGLSGIGYSLLRYYSDFKIPNLLSLD